MLEPLNPRDKVGGGLISRGGGRRGGPYPVILHETKVQVSSKIVGVGASLTTIPLPPGMRLSAPSKVANAF
ncbi:hypothetical protein CDL15_Pgr000983 [Punica granatum]|uniref:Uncharacterized protein n=1 Tax=Punica granatum TaxID=22663 RepID=A0A218XHY4_PUNGR|nr:hypothetical protein CDL15_Pgr000983 [Punica granatum]